MTFTKDMVRLNEHVPGDEIVSAVSGDGSVSVRAVTATGVVSNGALLHDTLPVASAALGRNLIAALLLSNGKKDGESVQIEFRGDGALRTVMAISNERGEVRGYVGDPFVHLPANERGKLDVGGAVGRRGFVSVVRNHPSYARPYRGITSIVSGEIGDDVLQYLVDSEQTPSALALGVFVKEGRVTAAGGYLVQMLPEAAEESLSLVERNIRQLGMEAGARDGSPTELVRSGMRAHDVMRALLRDMDGRVLDDTVRPTYVCTCTRSRVERVVALLPRHEVMSILEQEQQIEAKCEFCGRYYRLSANEATAIADRQHARWQRQQQQQPAAEAEAEEAEAEEDH